MMKRKSCNGFIALLFCLLVFNGSFAAAEIGVNPALPPEQDVFGVEPLDPPDPESRDYILVSDVKNAAESFNNEMRETRNIAISGKTVIFQAGHSNQLYDSYNENNDIKVMEIYAEKLIIRSPLNLPQTNVVIYASEVKFEDPDDGTYARINTTPRDKRDVDPGNNADGSGKNGINGLNAGNITLYAESLYSEPNIKRFIMTGGYGQKAGPGTEGIDGESMEVYYYSEWGTSHEWAYHAVYIEKWKKNVILLGLIVLGNWFRLKDQRFGRLMEQMQNLRENPEIRETEEI